MKTKLILVCFFVMTLGSTEAQLMQGTIRAGVASNQVEVWVKPNFTNRAFL